MKRSQSLSARPRAQAADAMNQMVDALAALVALYGAARAAALRQLRRGQLQRARRLRAHSSFLARMISALRAEIQATQLRPALLPVRPTR